MIENEMDFENRMVSPDFAPAEGEFENSLRPKTHDDYIGQEKAKEKPFDIHKGGKAEGRAS